MSTVLSEKMHAYEAAKAAGRVPYKVADLGLAEWGRKELRLAEGEMPVSYTHLTLPTILLV